MPHFEQSLKSANTSKSARAESSLNHPNTFADKAAGVINYREELMDLAEGLDFHIAFTVGELSKADPKANGFPYVMGWTPKAI
jgi:hypothetical protein